MGNHTKWRMTRGESLSHKFSKPRTFHKFNHIEKSAILGMVIIASIFLPAFAYYETNVVPYLKNKDPFTTIWNGQSGAPIHLSKYTPGYPTFIQAVCNGGVANNCKTSARPSSESVDIAIPQVQDFLLVAIYGYAHDSANCHIFSVSDSDANSYNFLGSDNTFKIAFPNDYDRPFLTLFGGYAAVGPPQNVASQPWIDTVTVTQSCLTNAPIYAITVSIWSGVSGAVGTYTDIESCKANRIYPSLVPVSCEPNDGNGLLVSTNDRVVNTVFSDLNSLCPIQVVTSQNSSVVRDYTTPCDNSFTGDSAFYSQFHDSTLATKSGEYFEKANTTIHYDTFHNNATIIMVSLSLSPDNPIAQCNPGYACFQSKSDNAGNFELFPTPTSSAYTLSRGTINLATGVSKELAWNEGFAINHTLFAPGVGIGWYMTNNGTISNNPTYNPLNDPAVVLAVVAYPPSANCQNRGTPFNVDCTWNVYVYVQKNLGVSMLDGSGVSENPFPSCPTSGSLYLCGQGKANITALQALVLNYTANAEPLNGGENGVSKLCFGLSVSNPRSCAVGGAGDEQINYVNGVQNITTQTLPWLNLQNQYYIGFWAGVGQRTIEYFNSAHYNVISLFIPTAATPSPPPATTDSGGFFGWISNIVGGTFNSVGSFLSPITAPLFNFGNSLMNAVIAGFTQSIALMIQGFRIVLNAMGNLVGFGNIGDVLIAAFSAIGTLIISGFSAIIGFFTALGSLINSGYFVFLAGAAVLIALLLPAAIVLWNIIFNGAFTITDILFFDYVIGMVMVFKAIENHKSALKALLGWIALNVFLFTFLFNAVWVIFDIVTRPIHRTKETIDPL